MAFADRSRGYRGPGQSSMQTAANKPTQADLAVVHALTTTIITYQQSQTFHAYFSQKLLEVRATNGYWIIDSGASHQLTFDPSLFADFQLFEENIAVTVGNVEIIKGGGTGRVSLDFPCGLRITIIVLYVPGIQQSLFSVSQFDNIVPMTFWDGYCYSGKQRIAIL